MIFKSGKANAGCWSFGPVLGLCAGYGNKRAGKNYGSKRRGRLNFPLFLLGRYSYG